MASEIPPEQPPVNIKLLRALALGGKRSVEIQLILDGASGDTDYRQLAWVLTGLSIARPSARVTFEHLIAHQSAMQVALGRPVQIKTAAMDCLENLGSEHQAGPDEPDLTYDQLIEMAFHDDLTGLPNYRSFCIRLQREMHRAKRYKHLFSLIMMDIDHFKDFNDANGHDGGNKALVHLADMMRAVFQGMDLLARYGGEEFAVSLPETPKHHAARLAEELRSRVESCPVELPESGEKPFTISLGLATYPRDAGDAQELLNRADAALYESKQTGRNRVSLHTPETSALLTYRPENPDAAQHVTVVGDFNGWDKEVDPMGRREDGVFEARIPLLPGRYMYKYVINGEFYMADPLAPDYVHDGFGGRNSLLLVKERERPQ